MFLIGFAIDGFLINNVEKVKKTKTLKRWQE